MAKVTSIESFPFQVDLCWRRPRMTKSGSRRKLQRQLKMQEVSWEKSTCDHYCHPGMHLSLIVSPKTAIWGEKLRNLPLIYDSWLACGAPVTTRGASPGCGCFFGHCLTLPCKDHFVFPVISTIPKCQGHIGKVRKSVTIAFIIHHTKESWKHTRNAFNVNNAII